MCKIHTINKCASINHKINPNNCLRCSTAHSIVLDSDWSKQLNPPKFWPTSSTASQCSKAGHKDLLLTRFARSKEKAKRRKDKAKLPRARPSLVEWLHVRYLYVINKHISNHYFIPSYPVLLASNSPVTIIVGHKTVLMTVLWPRNTSDNPIPLILTDDTICIINFKLQH